MHPLVVFHRADQTPIRFAGVHLAAGTAVNRQGGDAAVLQTFRQIDNDLRFMVPTQPGLHGHRNFHGIHHRFRNLQHQRNIPKHSGSGTLACDLLDRTTEIDVQYIRSCRLAKPCRLHHGIDIPSVYLYGYRTFLIANIQLPLCAVDAPYQGIARNEFGVHHIRPELLAQQSERRVGNILHRSQQHRVFSKIKIPYFHRLYPFCDYSKIKVQSAESGNSSLAVSSISAAVIFSIDRATSASESYLL